jgi:hypothetical protein
MAGDNPFDLTKLITNGGLIEKHKYKPEVFTTEEQKEMLKGFELVPRNKWAALEVGTHIRYLAKCEKADILDMWTQMENSYQYH